jgi:hypothetical protein
MTKLPDMSVAPQGDWVRAVYLSFVPYVPMLGLHRAAIFLNWESQTQFAVAFAGITSMILGAIIMYAGVRLRYGKVFVLGSLHIAVLFLVLQL